MKELILGIFVIVVVFAGLMWSAMESRKERLENNNAFCASLCAADQTKCYKFFMEAR